MRYQQNFEEFPRVVLTSEVSEFSLDFSTSGPSGAIIVTFQPRAASADETANWVVLARSLPSRFAVTQSSFTSFGCAVSYIAV